MSAKDGTIDLTRAIPPCTTALTRALKKAFLEMGSRNDVGLILRHNRPGGNDRDRAAAARWISRRLGSTPETDRILVTNGTQSAIALLLPMLVRDGTTLGVEALTYPVLRNLADRARVRVVPIEIDDEGLQPDVLANLAVKNRISAIFVNPTVHNPTTAVMSEKRRRDIVDIARRHGIAIIEDDVLGRMHGLSPRPFAAIAPESTWYLAATAKSLALGLRITLLLCPTDEAANQLYRPVASMSSWFPSALSAELLTKWISDGSGAEIEEAIIDEANIRSEIVAQALNDAPYRYQHGGLHLWIPFPSGESAMTFQARALERNVLIRNFGMFLAAPEEPHVGPWGVRVAITAPLARSDLADALTILRQLFINQSSHAIAQW
ncbi:PLP-dependent aminotransferase family protein [Bradyrhizobium sp. Cham227]|nr:PLP-dependent aminotransferase family protein [Bradyrhizobium brasilense]